ncbi:hypothetical protein M422DRAFT_208441 [Sphaerobolus stellatus SS14]|uniref:Kinetochore protein NDC80 n=1 Tax=Sphaerobolus stellatus (strain SS14) TaxID=990650 RepID=A0A0C9VZX4_SPHS4|nr:hypothetical protein M422DRAFT_208441 [Sphaerobolus stellatus SS14]
MEHRQTLYSAADPAGNARLNPQMPSSVAKNPPTSLGASTLGQVNNRQSNLPNPRQSLLPNPRQSMLPNPRQSMLPSGSQNMNPLLMSVQRPGVGDVFGKTPLSQRQNRRTLHGRQSMAPGASLASMSQPVKDGRLIRDKTFQQIATRQIHKFLNDGQFPGGATMKMLQSPTSKEYQAVFRWLFEILDPCYVLCKGGKTFEDEIIPTLKYHRYPAADAIKPSWFKAIASMHAWPSMLAVLHWMTLLCIVKTSYAGSDDPTVQNKALIPEVFGEEHNNTLAFEYYVEAYYAFLQGSDDFTEQDQELEERYARRNQAIFEERDQLQEELRQLQKEYDQATAAPAPITRLKADNANLKRDQMKFTSVNAHHRGKSEKYREAVKTLQSEIGALETNLQKLHNENEDLARKVKEQNLSPQEVTRMNTEHDTLQRTLIEMRRKVAETQHAYHNLEVALANRLSDVEHAVDDYMKLVWRLDPHQQDPAVTSNIDFTLTLDVAKDDPKKLVIGEDIRRTITPALIALTTSKREDRTKADNEFDRIEFSMERLTTECENLEQETNNVEARTNVLVEQADALRKAAQDDAHMNNTEATRLERELAQARAAAKSNGISAKVRLQALEIAYTEQVEKMDRLREETVKAIIKSSNEMCNFKEQVTEHIQHLRQFAEDN